MASSTDDRIGILQDISKSWLALVKVIRPMTDEQMMIPDQVDDWSIKDIMAHIAFWEGRVIHNIGLLERGETPPETGDFEPINQQEATRSRSASLDDVKAQFDGTHVQLMELLEVTPHLSRELVAGNTYEHYDEHLEDINKSLRK